MTMIELEKKEKIKPNQEPTKAKKCTSQNKNNLIWMAASKTDPKEAVIKR
jgi:hypothetical protein